MRLFASYGWSAGPERLPLLHHRIDAVTHLGMAWVCSNTSVPQSARAEFHLAPIPGQNPAFGDQFCRFLARVLQNGESLDLNTFRMLLDCRVDGCLRVPRSTKRN